MTEVAIAEQLLMLFHWDEFHSMSGNGEVVGCGLSDLFSSESPEDAERSRWMIENHAVAQGELFDVCEPCSSVLVAAFADPRDPWVRVIALDLLYQILSGYPSRTGAPPDIVARCRQAARDGLWLLHHEAVHGIREAALDVLELLGQRRMACQIIDLYDANGRRIPK